MSATAPTPPARFTLRQLPLPAKLVVTTFLLAVGLGYTSAMVQMHFQHTKPDGGPMPMVEDVVEIFAGKRKTPAGEAPARPVSKLEKLVAGPIQGAAFNGSGSMAPAFFHKDPSPGDKNYRRLTDSKRGAVDPALKAALDAEREGERKAILLWINLPADQRQHTYTKDAFLPPADQRPAKVTEEFLQKDGAVRVFGILKARCAECHKKGGDAEQYPLETYEQLAKYLEVPPAAAAGEWCPSERQISREKLAQSTHAHLLSFAMLFSLTGIVFAFTSYPGVVRGVLAPLVLVAQVADVSCWWLARLPETGPYFAMCIIATGGVVGLGLMAQIVLSLFNMYGPKGKLVIAGLFAAGGALGGWAYVEVVKPYLADRGKPKTTEGVKPPDAGTTPNGNGKADPVTKKEPEKKVETKPASPTVLEKLLTGAFDKSLRFNGTDDGGMVRAFYDKEKDFRDLFEKTPDSPEVARKTAERDAERAAVIAWIRTAPDARKKAYEEDKFALPAELTEKPVTASFKADDKSLKIKTLFDVRCGACHSPDKKQEDYPLTKYEEIAKYLVPADGEKADAGPPAANPAAAAAPPPAAVATDPIPPAKDD